MSIVRFFNKIFEVITRRPDEQIEHTHGRLSSCRVERPTGLHFARSALICMSRVIENVYALSRRRGDNSIKSCRPHVELGGEIKGLVGRVSRA